MHYLKPLLPFIAGLVLLLCSATFVGLSLANTIGQIVLFACVVCIPAWKTGRLSYVDIGWPLGLAVIGLITLYGADGDPVRKSIISLVYVFIGLRMGLGAIRMWRYGLLKKEFPRYQYQRLRWERQGIKNTALMIQVEALVQCFANASFLALPAFIIASNSSGAIHGLEIVGLAMWLGAFAVETLADIQKNNFMQAAKKQGVKNQVCDVGLWRYSRHPNYFAEWMVWNALIVASIPSWLALQSQENLIIWLLLGLALLNISRLMYITLVYYTGAKPAEYFSAQKRPSYREYQKNTNMFFPGPNKNTAD